MTKKTLYNNFPDWPRWDKHRTACKELHREAGYKERTIKSLWNKLRALEDEAREIRKKIKEKCSHPMKYLAVRQVDVSTCPWNEYWCHVYSCELCGQDLHRTDVEWRKGYGG